jgi:hypothetical protein
LYINYFALMMDPNIPGCPHEPVPLSIVKNRERIQL